MLSIPKVHVLDGNPEHVAHVLRKSAPFRRKNYKFEVIVIEKNVLHSSKFDFDKQVHTFF